MSICRSLRLVIVAALLPGAQAVAQSRPSFDGTWTLVDSGTEGARTTIIAASGDATFRVGDMGSGWGTTLTFSRRADRLVLEYPFFTAYDGMAPLHYEFALDGREVMNDVTIGPGVTHLRTRAAWRGDSLVITTQQPVPKEVAGPSAFAEVRRTLTLAGADSLQITTTRVGVTGTSSNTVRSIFARKR